MKEIKNLLISLNLYDKPAYEGGHKKVSGTSTHEDTDHGPLGEPELVTVNAAEEPTPARD